MKGTMPMLYGRAEMSYVTPLIGKYVEIFGVFTSIYEVSDHYLITAA